MTRTSRQWVTFPVILVAVAVGWAVESGAPRSIVHGARIAIAGHSFHVGIDPVLARIAQADGLPDEVLVGKVFVGGSRVIQVWEVPEPTNTVKTALRAGRVDVLTLSPHMLLPDPGIDKFVGLGLTGNPNLRVTLQESWMPFDNDSGQVRDPDPQHKMPTDWEAKSPAQLREIEQLYYRQLAEQVQAINAQCGKPVVFVVPTARALIELREQIRRGAVPGIKREASLFSDRMGHPNPVLVLLNAYCHFAVIYGRSPVGLTAFENAKELPPGLNRVLAQIAWNTVTAEPLSGVRLTR